MSEPPLDLQWKAANTLHRFLEGRELQRTFLATKQCMQDIGHGQHPVIGRMTHKTSLITRTSCQRESTPGVASIACISFGQGPRRQQVPRSLHLFCLYGQ